MGEIPSHSLCGMTDSTGSFNCTWLFQRLSFLGLVSGFAVGLV